MTARDRAARGSDEDGRIMLLTAGIVALALMIVGMVASATAVHLDRKHLFDLADAVAADAADAVPRERLLAGGAPAPEGEAVLRLTAADVEASARAYLAAHPDQAAGLDGLRVVEASAPDGRTAQVGLTATSHPPLLRWFTDAVGGGFTVAATSSARAG
ncbi:MULTISPECIES: hypothetical protein [unclassified Isoptericola]|uniref:hypothetical protein n=1 Tax=unclassified Isoptericola TaxID=2623355 RepID=UPI003657D81C